MVATLLWWVADIGFGFYVRKVPYNVVYGGLAAVIGLLIWMQISTIIIFLGAAWNAELAATSQAMRAHVWERRFRSNVTRAIRPTNVPCAIWLDGQMVDVAALEDRWYSPGATYFRMVHSNDERYVLRRHEAQDVLEDRGLPEGELPTGSTRVDTKINAAYSHSYRRVEWLSCFLLPEPKASNKGKKGRMGVLCKSIRSARDWSASRIWADVASVTAVQAQAPSDRAATPKTESSSAVSSPAAPSTA